jgi:hypothetical protein
MEKAFYSKRAASKEPTIHESLYTGALMLRNEAIAENYSDVYWMNK